MRVTLVLPLLLPLWVAAPASAQVGPYFGRPVAEVRLMIHGRPSSDDDLRNAVETRVGQPLQATQVRQSLVHLMALGRFEDVRADAENGDKGLVVTYDLVPIHVVRAVEYRGRLGLPEDVLRREVVDRYGVSPPLGRADDIMSSLEALYREHGYRNARVQKRIEVQDERDSATLGFEIEAGAQARVGQMTFEEDNLIPRADLLRKLGLEEGGPFDGTEVLARAAAFEDSLKAQTYYQASVDVAPSYSADGLTADLTITALRGPLISVEVKGEVLSREKRETLVPIARDKAVDEDLLEDWSSNLRRDLQSQGYKDATASWHRVESGGTLQFVFDVNRGRLFRVTSVRIVGGKVLAPQVARDTFGVREGQPFVQDSVDDGVRRLLATLRRDGYEGVSVQPETRLSGTTATQVSVEITVNVEEGQRSLIGDVQFRGNHAIEEAKLRSLVKLAVGQPFYKPDVDAKSEPILLAYLDDGYESAQVSNEIVRVDQNHVTVRFVIVEGPRILIDHVFIVGNTRTKASLIRSELRLESGQPVSPQRISDSQQRLSNLGLFRRVRITELPVGPEPKRDLVVTVEEAPATSITYGGGVEGGSRLRTDAAGNTVQAIELAPRGLFGIGRRNLWGKNRSINFNGSLAVRPTTSGVVGTGLREYRALGTYREPRILGGRADLLVAGGFEQAVRPAYSFNRRSIRADLSHRLSSTLDVYFRYSLERTRVFNQPNMSEQDLIRLGRILPRARLSKFSTSIARDTRDDAADPSRGEFLSWEGEVAPQFLGSEFGVAKTLLQAFAYRRLPTGRRIVFAGGLRLGLAKGYGMAPVLDDQGNEVPGPDGKPQMEPVTKPPLSERFFAGGNTTVRGVAEDSLGTPDTLTAAGFSTGGSGLLIFNAELRVSLLKGFSAVLFADAGNVFARALEIDPTRLQPATGFGLRYNSPFGPIRVDFGFNLNPRMLGGVRENRKAIYFGVGQAF